MNRCGDCVFLEKDDGFPYCLTLPLYTARNLEEEACECFVGANDPNRDKMVQVIKWRETNDERGQDPADVG